MLVTEPILPEYNSAHWWDPKSGAHLPKDMRDKARANSLIACARNLETVQQAVHEQNLMNAQLYSNRELAAFDWGTGALHRASLAPINRTGENLVLSIVDTLVAQVGKQRPKAKPQTRGASWRLRRQARRLDKFLYGEFHRNRVYELGKRVFRDACVFGFGALYLCITDGRVRIERVFPDEILIDQMEVVACGRPRHIYRRRVLPIEVVAQTWDVEEADLAAVARQTDYLEYRSIGKGWCVVVEAWQLSQGTDKGRYSVGVNGLILDEGEYDSEHPPFVFYHWCPFDGFYNPSAVEQALPYQIRLNEISEVIRDAQDIMARPRLLVAEGSRVNPYELDNLVAKIIKYTGIKPEAVTWEAANAELYNERDRCWAQCRDQFGVGSMATSAQAPQSARFDSSEAFREFNAIQDDRLADPSQRLEQFYLDVAEGIIRTIKREKASPTTMWYSGGRHSRCEVIHWDEIDLDEDSYVLQLEATSVYSMGPAAIRDNLEKQLAMGVITPEQYRLELAHPDDEAELSLQAAAAADLRRVVELLEEGEYEDPTPVQDLVNGVQIVSLALLNLSQYEDDDPEVSLADVKLNFIDWILAARNIIEPAADQEPNGGEQPLPGVGTPVPGMGPPPGAPPGMATPMGPGASPFGPAAVPVPEPAGMNTTGQGIPIAA